jgi:hypothetical protein
MDAMINDARLAMLHKGIDLRTRGFINSAIHPSQFANTSNDITTGKIQNVVCVLTYTQTCTTSNGWFYRVRICSSNPYLAAKPL